MKDAQVVKEVKETIKELLEAHKSNINYRPYAQDISYAMKARSDRMHPSTKEVQWILTTENIVIKQPSAKEKAAEVKEAKPKTTKKTKAKKEVAAE